MRLQVTYGTKREIPIVTIEVLDTEDVRVFSDDYNLCKGSDRKENYLKIAEIDNLDKIIVIKKEKNDKRDFIGISFDECDEDISKIPQIIEDIKNAIEVEYKKYLVRKKIIKELKGKCKPKEKGVFETVEEFILNEESFKFEKE